MGLLPDGVVAVGVADDDVPAVLGELLAGHDIVMVFRVILGVPAAPSQELEGGVDDFLAGDADAVRVVLLLCVCQVLLVM